MKKSTKTALITAGSLIFLGLVFILCSLAVNGWSLGAFGNNKLETKTIEIDEDFDKLSVDTADDDISFVLTDDNECRIVCLEREKTVHTAEVTDKTLKIASEDTGAWYESFSLFSSGTPKITVYLPKSEYTSLLIDEDTGDISIPEGLAFDSIDIKASTGDVTCGASSKGTVDVSVSTGSIKLSGAEYGELRLTVSTGDIEVSSVTCESISSTGSTGDITLTNVIASKTISVERTTGDVALELCDAEELRIETGTGDVTGTLLSEKEFVTHTATGSVNVPKTASGGRCEISATTGDIIMTVKE